MVVWLSISVYPEELIVKGFAESFDIAHVMNATCEVPSIHPVPFAIYWLYNRTRVHRGWVSYQMNTDMKDYKVISIMHFTIAAEDQGCSLKCVVEMADGKQLESQQNIIRINEISSKWHSIPRNVIYD